MENSRLINTGETPRMAFLLVLLGTKNSASGLTGVTAEISKNGSAFAAVTNAVTEIGNGWYYVDLTATETDTAGPLLFRAIKTGTPNVTEEWRTSSDVGTNDPVVLDSSEYNTIADYILRRPLASARASSDGDALTLRSLIGALSKMINRTAMSGTTLNIYEEDDASVFGTQTATTTGTPTYISELDTN